MTTKSTSALLEPVCAALVCANLMLGVSSTTTPAQRERAAAETEQALVELVCAACDAVARWEESERDSERRDQTAMPARMTSWPGQLDDLRVQASLTQMELRDSPHQALVAVEQSASAVEQAVITSAREVAVALHAFRAALRPND